MLAGLGPVRVSEPGLVAVLVKLTGNGDADPTKNYGAGLTVTRTGVGVFRLTWAESLGTFVTVTGPTFGDSTPGDVKGHDLTWDTDYSAANRTLDVSIWDAAEAADELNATETLSFFVWFKTDTIGAV